MKCRMAVLQTNIHSTIGTIEQRKNRRRKNGKSRKYAWWHGFIFASSIYLCLFLCLSTIGVKQRVSLNVCMSVYIYEGVSRKRAVKWVDFPRLRTRRVTCVCTILQTYVLGLRHIACDSTGPPHILAIYGFVILVPHNPQSTYYWYIIGIDMPPLLCSRKSEIPMRRRSGRNWCVLTRQRRGSRGI